jgi:hypothetical protein
MAVKHTVKTGKMAMIGDRWQPETREVLLTRGKAIRLFCYECMGFQKSEVPRCTSLTCPLYPYRPGKNLSEKHTHSYPDAPGSTIVPQPIP